MTIQWFPGHMAKARRQVQEKLKQVDVVIELLDARIPISSRNPMMDEIVKEKPRLVLLNKSDLADSQATREWIDYFQKEEQILALPIDAVSGYQVNKIPQQAETLVADKREALIRKGVNPRAVRALILGIPNVGKSSLINRLSKRNIAQTGDKPGVTKAQQWIKVGTQMELLDTPGILWPKFEDQQVGVKLAATGAIKDEILHYEELAYQLMGYLHRQYPQFLVERYGLDPLPEDRLEAMEEIGRKRGCIQSGGHVNLEKVSELILREFRGGKIGKITLELPYESSDHAFAAMEEHPPVDI
jgi:ribosome biogenesis GTPase A